jgi:hypothetical protein
MNTNLVRRLLPVTAAIAALAVPASALAAGSTTTTTAPTTTTTTAPTTTTTAAPPTTTTTTTTTPTVTPKPAKASANLYSSGLFSVNKAPVTVPGRAVTVSGVVRPYIPGQAVLLKAYVGKKLFKTVKLNLKPSKRRVYGGFTYPVTAPTAGKVTVTVLHSANTAQAGFTVKDSWSALSETVGSGATGPFVDLLQERLAALHLYIPQTGVFDQGTTLALNAYHRLLGWGEGDTSVGPATVTDLLNGVGAFHIRYPGQGRHAEGDLSDQVLALINGNQVQALFPISSGKPSTPTVLGSWRIYLRDPGYLSDGMYYSDFFTGGYAIHGYDPAPDYPASHGCMRLPIVDAIPAFNWLAIGDWVDSYYT